VVGNDPKLVNRLKRQKWLENPENKAKDREKARLRYHTKLNSLNRKADLFSLTKS
jgi:hypothetical protein